MDDETKTTLRLTPQIILGFAAIVLGILFTLDNLHIIDAGSYIRFWPAALIAVGLAKVVGSRETSGLAAGTVLAAVGTLWLLSNMRILRASIWDFWPLVLVLVGLSLVWNALRGERSLSADPSSRVNAIAIMGGVSRKCNSQDFRGGELTAFCGGCELDLRGASIQSGVAVVRTLVWWGGIEIRVPEDWSVALKGLPLMAGFEDSTHPPPGGSDKVLVVKGFALMGGVEIKN